MSTLRVARLCVVVFTLFTPDVIASNTSPVAVQPSRIQIAHALQAEVDGMLRRSATFREQYRRLAETPFMVVGINVDPALCNTTFRARTTFRRYASGLMVVAVSIGPGSHQAEWIAHEFEHILEQLDGRDLKQLATERSGEVWYSASGVFETRRAERAGRVVFDEVRRYRITQ